ncbi:hypothetical protein POVCU2_0094040 [Plasmodium ovale curtisi]|uniref:Uncharacterized protein n=1 Tax=Plasmodium ovale curtisi TaxID=864141 RepID=A0A1A8WQN7_PLAOA|nr:hypothetical protein POVCU2_0094040 [Plasmodium ovale curtisi]
MHRQGQIGYANAGNNGCAKNCSEMVLKKVHNKRRTQKCAQRRAGKAYIRRTDLREAYGNVERRTEMCRGVQIRAEAYRYEQRRTDTSRGVQIRAQTYRYVLRRTDTCSDVQGHLVNALKTYRRRNKGVQ